MATPLDPDRWSEFATPRPRGARQSADPAPARHPPKASGANAAPANSAPASSALANSAPKSVHELMNLDGNSLDGNGLPAIALVASLVGQMAHASLVTVDSADLAEARTLNADELFRLLVGGDGVIRWPEGAVATNESLLRVLRRATRDQGLPPELARILLARPMPELRRIADVLDGLGQVPQSAQALASRSRPVPSSPLAARIPRGSSGAEHLETAGSAAEPPTGDPGLPETLRVAARVLTWVSRRPKLIISAVVGTAVALVVLLSGLVAGASASAPVATSQQAMPESLASAGATQVPQLMPSGQSARPSAEDITGGTGSQIGRDVQGGTGSQIGVEGVVTGEGRDATPISWAAVLADLDAKRQRLFESADLGLLTTYARTDSPVARRDAASHRELGALGARAVGVSARIQKVSLRSMVGSAARLEVIDELSGYRIVRIGSGELLEERPPRQAKRWVVELEKVDGNWLLVDAQPDQGTDTAPSRAPAPAPSTGPAK